MAETTTKKLRVLFANGEHKPNHVISLPTKEADAAVKAGWADDDEAAIAYAEKNEAQPDPAKA